MFEEIDMYEPWNICIGFMLFVIKKKKIKEKRKLIYLNIMMFQQWMTKRRLFIYIHAVVNHIFTQLREHK